MSAFVGRGLVEIVLRALQRQQRSLHVRLIRSTSKNLFGIQSAGVIVTAIKRLRIPIVGRLQPALHFGIDFFQRSYFKTMCDSILFGETAGVD